MLDYNGLLAAVAATTNAFQEALDDPLVAGAGEELARAAEDEPDIVRLGAMLGPLLGQAGSEPEELDLLRRADELWRRGMTLAQELETARIEFELSLARHDLPDAVQVLQMGLDRLAGLHAPVKALVDEVQALRSEVDTLGHLAPHPRQADAPTADWDWVDLFAGRRSFAFVEAMREAAGGDARKRAFAGGAIAGYAGHVAGSAWVGAVVGGPRRLHRFRDRLARNTVGVALRRAAAAPDLGDLAGRLRFEARDVPVLPQDLKGQLTTALTAAYPGRAIPDLNVAHGRMIEHLELLTGFVVPDPPEPPPIVENPDGEPAVIETQTFGAPQDEGGTITLGPETNHDSPGVSSQKKAQGDICGYILLLIVTLGIAYLVWCIGRLSTDKKCGFEDFLGASSPEEPDPRAPQANQQMLETLREAANVNHILSDIYQLQIRIWQGFAAARSFLTVCGLVPPNEQELGLPLFSQFLTLPSDGVWPHRESADAETTYTDHPSTPAEDPVQPVPFPGRGWEWLLHVSLADNESTFSEVVYAVLRNQQRVNLDLDADRGRLHPAWAVAQGTSIADQPLSVAVLPFAEV